ncbi:uncharacterized protein B0I36DRAFT_350015 [Microdochium trichocladiopsis]|uniref:Uncharacterized protein n=1 Tax=Microdochium trichocladiopsis TaxID=1682393 RepID=A0A9P8Y3J6_9PEZI|nr:uncharacterized protein B0I36DRAFT_350015 [Microdochium trichocladiopsis]KAH7029073.1 hypothetical protein B0I36DRAFT_350015 [Microdochium trichocladiopsis]
MGDGKRVAETLIVVNPAGVKGYLSASAGHVRGPAPMPSGEAVSLLPTYSLPRPTVPPLRSSLVLVVCCAMLQGLSTPSQPGCNHDGPRLVGRPPILARQAINTCSLHQSGLQHSSVVQHGLEFIPVVPAAGENRRRLEPYGRDDKNSLLGVATSTHGGELSPPGKTCPRGVVASRRGQPQAQSTREAVQQHQEGCACLLLHQPPHRPVNLQPGRTGPRPGFIRWHNRVHIVGKTKTLRNASYPADN